MLLKRSFHAAKGGFTCWPSPFSSTARLNLECWASSLLSPCGEAALERRWRLHCRPFGVGCFSNCESHVMKSPFPGMDPYLEQRWLGVHSSLTTYAGDALNRLLPPGLLARSEERAIVSSDDEELRAIGRMSRSSSLVLPSQHGILAGRRRRSRRPSACIWRNTKLGSATWRFVTRGRADESSR